MGSFYLDVVCSGTWIERTVISANSKEEAIQKIKDGADVDDVLDIVDLEADEIIDIF